MTARYTLYGLFASAPSYKVGLMLTLCDEAFDYVHVNLREGAHKKPDYLKINRFGQVPALVDNSNGKTLCQSGAILEYLADKTGKFGGASLDDRLRAREWLFGAGINSTHPSIACVHGSSVFVRLNPLWSNFIKRSAKRPSIRFKPISCLVTIFWRAIMQPSPISIFMVLRRLRIRVIMMCPLILMLSHG